MVRIPRSRVDPAWSVGWTSEVGASMSDHSVIPLVLIGDQMADDKKGRDKQADDEERRQRERELEEARDRADEAEPMHDDPGERLGDLDEALENHDYPTTTDELIEAFGDREVQTQGGWTAIEEVLAPVDNQRYVSADDVRSRIQGLIRR